jgi:hypothetical protein
MFEIGKIALGRIGVARSGHVTPRSKFFFFHPFIHLFHFAIQNKIYCSQNVRKTLFAGRASLVKSKQKLARTLGEELCSDRVARFFSAQLTKTG